MGNSFSQMATFEIGTVVEGYTDNQRENEYIVQLIGAALHNSPSFSCCHLENELPASTLHDFK